MERYEAYKDSGVEWIGEIPAGWSSVRLKYLALNRVKPAESDAGVYLGLENVTSWTMELCKSDGQSTDSTGVLYDSDCVLFGKLRPYLAKIALPNASGPCSSEFLVLMPLDIARKYLAYTLSNELFINEVGSLTYGVRMPRAGWDLVGNMRMPVPPKLEQQAIADYLDAKTAEIDSLVADCEREVELLQEYRKAVISEAVTKGLNPDAPMKDSGIEWIGEIPAGWEVMQLSKLCVRIFDGPFGSNLKSADYIDEGIRVVRLENLKYLQFDSTKESYVTPEKYDIIKQHTVFPEDLIVATFIIDSVKACRLPKDIIFAVNKADCLGVRTKEQIEVDFLKYYLSSSQVYEYLVGLTHGSTRPRINTMQLKTLQTLLPPIDIQRQIVDYLDNVCAEIDSLIDAKRSMADKLREYRRSLISEAVTGKFRVPGV